MPKTTKISDTLRAEIKAYPETLYKLAKACDISLPVLSRFVKGERDLKLETVDKIAKTLNLKLIRK
ncbi:MAG: hypothetical protein CMJ50_03495 [Planctomycetaceae bacterium]|nr:hypothetical protein [Planctomycetaceae bacterium]